MHKTRRLEEIITTNGNMLLAVHLYVLDDRTAPAFRKSLLCSISSPHSLVRLTRKIEMHSGIKRRSVAAPWTSIRSTTSVLRARASVTYASKSHFQLSLPVPGKQHLSEYPLAICSSWQYWRKIRCRSISSQSMPNIKNIWNFHTQNA